MYGVPPCVGRTPEQNVPTKKEQKIMGFNLDNYEPVADRIGRFRNEYPLASIETELISDMGGTGYRFIATIAIEGLLVSTGHAEEIISDRGVNAAHALENAETSAVGRALANFGLRSTGGVPTREDMENLENRTHVSKALKHERQRLRERIESFTDDQRELLKNQALERGYPSLKHPMSGEQVKAWRDLIDLI